jgi:hypothetical protein
MDIETVGYYDGRTKTRTPIKEGTYRAAFGEKPNKVRVETFSGMIVLTHPGSPSYRDRRD